MQTTFGLVNLWEQGDAVTRLVVVLLLMMSLASWTVIAVKGIGATAGAKAAIEAAGGSVA